MSGYLWRGRPDLEAINAAIMAARSGKQAENTSYFEWRTACSSSRPSKRDEAERVANAEKRYRESRGHGTYGGYQQHMRSDRQPCEACRLAERAYGNAVRRAKRRARLGDADAEQEVAQVKAAACERLADDLDPAS